MTLAARISALSTRLGNYVRDNILPRLLPASGTSGQVLIKSGNGGYASAWSSQFGDNDTITADVLKASKKLNRLFLDASASSPYIVDVYDFSLGSLTYPLLEPLYVVNTSTPKVIRVTNPQNSVVNDTIPVITGDVLLPYYDSNNGSWGYKVVRDKPFSSINLFELIFPNRNKLHYDSEFLSSYNNITLFNNAGNSNVLMDRISGDFQNNSGFGLRFTHTGIANPELGGFYLATPVYSGARYIVSFRARLPIGYKLNFTSNYFGDGGVFTWVSTNEGTEKWEDYIGIVQCGLSGTFTNTNFFYLTGIEPTAIKPLVWLMASLQVFDITEDTYRNMSTSQINSIITPQEGWKIYNTTLHCMCFYNGSSWQKVTSTAM